MNPVLSVSNLSVAYGAHIALDGFSAVLDAGSVTGLIGPNGAGKTSLIKALCGRADVTSGSVTINGKTLTPGSARQKFIGLVPQDIGLYGHMTARENLTVFAQMMGAARHSRDTAVDDALHRVGLTERAHMRVDALSGGMKRRINVAAAIMHKPPFLIMDEPTAGVDVAARDAVHTLARDLAASGICVLLVTHELEQAESVCDQLLVLSKGRLLAAAPPDELLAQCYKGQRDVTVRLVSAPGETVQNHLRGLGLAEGEHPTTWGMLTNQTEAECVSRVMTALQTHEIKLRDISAGRPGLSALIRHVETAGTLPC